jgi:hypothetical protein
VTPDTQAALLLAAIAVALLAWGLRVDRRLEAERKARDLSKYRAQVAAKRDEQAAEKLRAELDNEAAFVLWLSGGSR